MLYRLTPGRGHEVLRENTGGGNGTTFDLQGRPVVCKSDGSIYFTDPGLRVPLAERELPYAGWSWPGSMPCHPSRRGGPDRSKLRPGGRSMLPGCLVRSAHSLAAPPFQPDALLGLLERQTTRTYRLP